MTEDIAWKPFETISAERPWERAVTWKQQTAGKIVGHLLPDVPEEIIHTAGALPVAVWGAGVQISHAQAHIPGYTCSHAMGALEHGLRSNLEFLDGMIIPYVCDTTRNLFHIWQQCFPNMHNEFLRVPKRIDYPAARAYLRSEYGRLFDSMKSLTGRNVGAEDVLESIALYNASRKMLRRAYEKQQDNPSVWTQSRVMSLFQSSLLWPRQEHVDLMSRLPWDSVETGSAASRIPVYVRGKIWDPPTILDLFNTLGLVLIGDEIVTGYRMVAQDVSMEGDPLDALVERFLRLVPYPGYHSDPEAMVQDFVDRVRRSGGQGVIFLNPKFCEAAGFDTPDFQKGLQDNEIPSLVLETSARGTSLEQIKVRLEAFKEILSGDLP
jgi:benzoyl-CoA reductase subunit C